jgi:hypothetical protein
MKTSNKSLCINGINKNIKIQQNPRWIFEEPTLIMEQNQTQKYLQEIEEQLERVAESDPKYPYW